MKDFEENLVFEIQMSKVWKSSIQKLSFSQKRNFSKRDLDLIMIIKEDENCQ